MSFQSEVKKVCCFKEGATLQFEILNIQLKDMLVKKNNKNKYIWVANKKYKKWKMADFLANVVQTPIIKFQANSNYQRLILKQIQHIHFTELQYLNLESNWITSIEILIYLNAPKLEFINLKNNEITEMKALRKIDFPKLKSFKVNTHKHLAVFSQMDSYNRHNFYIAQELLRYHTQSVFSPRIKKILENRRPFYMLENKSQTRKKRVSKRKQDNSDEDTSD